MFAKDLREDAYASETSILRVAHLTKPIVNWPVENVDGEIFQNLGSAVVGESIRVSAGVSGGEEHDSGMVVVGRHIRYIPIIYTILLWGGVGVISHDESPVVSFDGGRCAMAQPHQVPAVTIR